MCDQCNYDTHRCSGCGANTTHAQGNECPSCAPIIRGVNDAVTEAIHTAATKAKATGKSAHVEVLVARRTLTVSVAPARKDDPSWVNGVRWHVRLRVDAEQALALKIDDARSLDLWIGQQECGLNVLCAPSRMLTPFPGMALRLDIKAAEDKWVGHMVSNGRWRDAFWLVVEPKKEQSNG